MHGQEFREPFSKASKGTMLSLMLPEGNEADIRFTQLAIADLKRRWVQQVQPIHAHYMLSKERTVPSWNIKREILREKGPIDRASQSAGQACANGGW